MFALRTRPVTIPAPIQKLSSTCFFKKIGIGAGHSAVFTVLTFMEDVFMQDDTPPPRFSPENYRDYLCLMARIQLRYTPSAKVDASDVVNDALLRAVSKRQQFDGKTEGQWRSWLRQILRHAITDAFRDLPPGEIVVRLDNSDSRLQGFVPLVNSTPSGKCRAEELIARLTKALANLPDDERSALEMRYYQQPSLKLEEIAQLLGRPTSKSVSGLLARGLMRLREQLAETT
jgi:RNA polymerase sigma-70 factor (subfamily 1)